MNTTNEEMLKFTLAHLTAQLATWKPETIADKERFWAMENAKIAIEGMLNAGQ